MTTRDTHGSRAPHRSKPPQRGRGGSSPVAGSPLRLTARGAIVSLALLSFSSALLASLIEQPVVNGLGFLFTCALVSSLVRPSDLLRLSVSPPLAYFVAALGAESLLTLGHDGFVRGVAIGLATRLAEVAPWLFAGTVLVLVIAVMRGLAKNVRALGDELNGRTRRSRRHS